MPNWQVISVAAVIVTAVWCLGWWLRGQFQAVKDAGDARWQAIREEIISRVGKLEQVQAANDRRLEDLRRGRGLILGQDSDWPDAVRRCFGFGRGPH